MMDAMNHLMNLLFGSCLIGALLRPQNISKESK